MLPAVLFLFQTGVIALLSGLGLASWIWPATLRAKGLDLPVTMMLGFGFLAVIAGYFFLLDATVVLAVPATLLASAVLLALRFFHLPIDARDGLARIISITPRHALIYLAGAILGGVLIIPGIVPNPGQPFRIGIDCYGYGTMSQVLLDGHTRHALETELVRETGQADLAGALANADGALNLNVSVTAGFLLGHLRVGYPCLLAALLHFLGQPLAYPYLVLMFFWPAIIFLALGWFFFHHIIGTGYTRALLFALALGFNCNLLNVACEGQHSQWFVAPYLALFFILIFINRRAPEILPAWRGELLLTSALAAFIIILYAEALYALLVVALLTLLADLICGHWDSVRANLRFASAIVIGFLATGPAICLWVPVFLHQASDVAAGQAGFWQPLWANPAEIMGWIDIYAHVRMGDDLMQRPALLLGIETLMSLLAIGVVIASLRKISRREMIYWLAPVLFVALVFVQTHLVRHILNYAYMKSYTILGFPLLTLFYVALDRWSREPGRISQHSARCIVLAPALCSLLVGWFYLKTYRETATYLPPGITALRELGTRVDFSRVVLLTPHHYQLRGAVLYASLGMFIPANWWDFHRPDSYLLPFNGRPIYILGYKSEIAPDRLAALLQKNQDRLIFQNDAFYVLDSGKVVPPAVWQIGVPYRFMLYQDSACSHRQEAMGNAMLDELGF